MRSFLPLAVTTLLAMGPAPAVSLVFVVDRLDDQAGLSGCDTAVPLDCSLRTAISLANVSPGPDEIHLPSGTFELTIPGVGEDDNQTGDLDVDGELTILGVPGDRPLITSDFAGDEEGLMAVSGPSFELRDVDLLGFPVGAGKAVLGIDPGGEVLLESVSVESSGSGHAIVTESPAALTNVVARAAPRVALGSLADTIIEDSFFEGALGVQGAALTMKRSVVEWPVDGNPHTYQAVVALTLEGDKLLEDCRIEALGEDPPIGGVLVSSTDASFVMRRTVVRGFTNAGSNAAGSGVSVERSGLVTIEDSLIEQNTAGAGEGGGLRLSHGGGTPYTAIVSGSSFVGNEAAGSNGAGGAVFLDEGVALNLRNSTLTGNDARFGAGVWAGASSQLSLEHVTLSGQAGSAGTAIFHLGAVDIEASLVAGTCSGTGSLTSLGSNLESPGDTCGFALPSDLPNVADPALAALAWDGGSTPTLTPLPGSPARDFAICALPVDQRGAPRPHDGGGGLLCDAGAVEAGSPPPGSIFADGFEQGDVSSWDNTLL